MPALPPGRPIRSVPESPYTCLEKTVMAGSSADKMT
jgi:hypothetical protein